MSERSLDILLIEDSLVYAVKIKEILTKGAAGDINLTHANQLSTGLQYIADRTFDLILLDLILPDSQGLETFLNVHVQCKGMPIIVLTGMDDETLAMTAVARGAQDYLVKSSVNTMVLIRSIRYAIERHRLLAELRSMSFVDELTGLHNRRGFFTLAQQQLKVADRAKKGLMLIFADLDHMKGINDTWGHQFGDQALKDVADIIRATFRVADITARLGGDEFVVLAVSADSNSEAVILGRLQQNIQSFNERGVRPFTLSVSTGVVYYDTKQPGSLQDLLTQADTLMYEQKRGKGRR